MPARPFGVQNAATMKFHEPVYFVKPVASKHLKIPLWEGIYDYASEYPGGGNK